MKDSAILIFGAIYTLFLDMLGPQLYIRDHGLESEAAFLTVTIWIICVVCCIRTIKRMTRKKRNQAPMTL